MEQDQFIFQREENAWNISPQRQQPEQLLIEAQKQASESNFNRLEIHLEMKHIFQEDLEDSTVKKCSDRQEKKLVNRLTPEIQLNNCKTLKEKS